MPLNLKQLHRQVVKLIPHLDKILLDNYSKTNQVSFKPTDELSISIVTQLDSQIEKSLKQDLKKILPEAGFIGEETGLDLKAEYNWIIDPIDGTLNYASRIPNFAISIALWQQNQPIYSLVSFPAFKELIYALKGEGLFLNDQPIKHLEPISPKPFIVYSAVGHTDLVKEIYNQIVDATNAPRSYGSCVFHGAYTALGRINAGVFINQALWDIGAITLLAQEAGLTVKYLSSPPNLAKDNLKKYQYSLVIGEKKLAENLCRTISI